MKFPNLNSVSYNLDLGFEAPSDPKNDTIQYRTFINGNISTVNFGARLEYISTFKLVDIEKDDFLALMDYLILNGGEKILLQKEYEDESIFTEAVPGGGVGNNDYYVYVLEPSSFQEEDFSGSDRLHTLTLKVALAGATSSAVPNADGTSFIDCLITLDTTGEAIKGGTEPTVRELEDRWLDTVGNEGDANELYECIDPTGATFADRWSSLYNVKADDTNYGFKDGVFYWAAFSTITYNSNTYKAGLINNKSIKPPGKNISINRGPNIERREGFSYAINNNYLGEKFWSWLIANNISLFGGVSTLGVWNNTPSFKALGKGKNNQSKFDYINYRFQIEPFAYNKTDKHPDEVIADTEVVGERYDGIQTQFVEKPPYVTYGEHELAALQNISTDKEDVLIDKKSPGSTEFTPVPTFKVFINSDTSPQTEIYMLRTGLSDVIYQLDADFLADLDNAVYAMECIRDSNDPTSNEEEVRKIESVATIIDYYVFTINEAFTTSPTPNGGAAPATDDYLTIRITKQKYQFQIDEKVCGGFGEFLDGTFVPGLKLYGLDDSGKEIISVPQSEYIINSQNNLVLLDPINSVDESAVFIFGPINIAGWKPFPLVPMIDTSDDSTADQDFNGDTPGIDLAPPKSSTNVTGSDYQLITDTSRTAGNFTYVAYIEAPEKQRYVRISMVTNLTFYLIERLVKNNASAYDAIGEFTQTDSVAANNVLHAVAFTIQHSTTNDATFTSSSDNKLCINFKLHSVNVLGITGGHKRYRNVGFKMIMRFKKRNGDYVVNTSWKKEFNADQLSIGFKGATGTSGNILVNNFPDGSPTSGNFKEGVSTLTKLYHKQVVLTGEEVTASPLYSSAALAQASPSDLEGAALVNIIGAGEFNPYIAFSNVIPYKSYFMYNNGSEYAFVCISLISGPSELLSVAPGARVEIVADGNGDLSIHKTSWNFILGDKWADTDSGRIREYEGSFTWSVGDLFVNDERILEKSFAFTEYFVELYWIDNGTLTVVTEQERYNAQYPTFYGRDIFDISGEPFDTGDWPDIIAAEFLFVNKDFSDDPYNTHYDSDNWFPTWSFSFKGGNDIPLADLLSGSFEAPEPIALYTATEIETIDKPLFTPTKGRSFYEDATLTSGVNVVNELTLTAAMSDDVPQTGEVIVTSVAGIETTYVYTGRNTTTFFTTVTAATYTGGETISIPVFSKKPFKIVKDIMNSSGMYRNKWNEQSLTDLTNLTSRAEWNFRRQYTSSTSSEKTLKEILENLWACAITNEDDELVFRTMYPGDISTTVYDFTDDTIINNSISAPKFRKLNEVYTEFNLYYDYHIPSEFSASLKNQEFLKPILLDKDTGTEQTKQYIKISRDLYGIKNKYTNGFKFHYESLVMSEWVAQWFALNVWQFSIRTTLERLISENFKLMDFISIKSYFHTNNEKIEGFITKIKPDFYTATVEIGVHVYRPPGVFGPLCDNFNDAKTTDRDISLWNDANGKINDAGTTSRSIGSYTIKDAGVPGRTFEC